MAQLDTAQFSTFCKHINSLEEEGYTQGRKCGEPGAQGIVYTCTKTSTGEVFAVKVVPKSKLDRSPTALDRFKLECLALMQIQHPHIMRLYNVYEDGDHYYMVCEKMDMDLFDYVVQHKKFSEEDAAKIIRGMLQALAFLHDIGLIHRDIKLENVLVNAETGDVKLADFGLVKVVYEGGQIRCTPGVGTVNYLPPEILLAYESNARGEYFAESDTIKKLDLWSLGIVMYILLSGKQPWKGSERCARDVVERKKLLSSIQRKIDPEALFRDRVWEQVGEHAKDLLVKLLEIEADKRLSSAHAALHHPWLVDSSLPLRTPAPGGVNLGAEDKAVFLADANPNAFHEAEGEIAAAGDAAEATAAAAVAAGDAHGEVQAPRSRLAKK